MSCSSGATSQEGGCHDATHNARLGLGHAGDAGAGATGCGVFQRLRLQDPEQRLLRIRAQLGVDQGQGILRPGLRRRTSSSSRREPRNFATVAGTTSTTGTTPSTSSRPTAQAISSSSGGRGSRPRRRQNATIGSWSRCSSNTSGSCWRSRSSAAWCADEAPQTASVARRQHIALSLLRRAADFAPAAARIAASDGPRGEGQWSDAWYQVR